VDCRGQGVQTPIEVGIIKEGEAAIGPVPRSFVQLREASGVERRAAATWPPVASRYPRSERLRFDLAG
jgi:hypothetical protein